MEVVTPTEVDPPEISVISLLLPLNQDQNLTNPRCVAGPQLGLVALGLS